MTINKSCCTMLKHNILREVTEELDHLSRCKEVCEASYNMICVADMFLWILWGLGAALPWIGCVCWLCHI